MRAIVPATGELAVSARTEKLREPASHSRHCCRFVSAEVSARGVLTTASSSGVSFLHAVGFSL